ncbi:SRPBCC family protein [Sorangium sp. So ce1153]|uniref:SRPBCC family protein n=1 Tax=Sorangium sp. So ce1153 TaxID=3133333 RepID=UPI003F640C17
MTAKERFRHDGPSRAPIEENNEMPLRFTIEEQIDASPEEVFRLATDIDAFGDWMPNFVRAEKLTDGVVGKGAMWRETRKMFGKESTEQFEVTAAEPGKSLDLFIDGQKGTTGRGEYRFRYVFEPAGDGTLLKMDGEIAGMGWFMETLGRLFIGSFKKAVHGDLKALKSHLERRRAS